jgi:hypothetical protein
MKAFLKAAEKRLMLLAGAAALLAAAVPSTAHASNANTQDCNGNWVGGPYTANSETVTGGAVVTVYTQVNYSCWWTGQQYALQVQVSSFSNDEYFAAYDCAGVYVAAPYNQWYAQGCAAPTYTYVPAAYVNGIYFPPVWSATATINTWGLLAGWGFGSNDRSGTANTTIQPTGGAQEWPYVENWKDQ